MVRAVLISVMLAVVALAATAVWALHDLSFSAVLEPPAEPIVILEAADGSELSRKGPVQDPPVAREDIPQHLVDAVLAIEDRRFYDHWGVDPFAILRAAVRNVRASTIVEGGSTITQQLVKLRLGDDERTLRRKIREAALAVWLETHLSKGEILTAYLNTAYFGAGATGVSAAARVYFDKAVSDLTLEESVLLAGLVTAPSRLNPLQNRQAAEERASVVLDAMVDSRRLDSDRAEAAKAQPAMLNEGRFASSSPTWFSDWVIAAEAGDIARSFGDGRVAIRVRTTLDPRLQAVAEEVINAALDNLGEANGEAQAALVAMRPDGAVVAMVGGRSYQESEFNRAVQAMRQPGSTFKLFVYFAALRNGYSPDQTIEDAPLEIDGWTADNFAGQYHGTVTLADAFARSLNAATVRLAHDVGIDEVVEAAQFLGIDAPLRATPSLALGTSEVSLLDLTGAYASVLAGVAPLEPVGVAGYGGLDQQHLLAPGPPARARQSLGPYQRPLIALLERVVNEGTGRAAVLDGFAAGKTGTSANYRDAWFVGFTESLVAGVWVGHDNGEPMDEMTGGKVPASIWKSFMSEAGRILGGEPRPAEPRGDETVAVLEPDDDNDQAERDALADAPVFGSPAGQTWTLVDRQPDDRAEPGDRDRYLYSAPGAFGGQDEPEHIQPSLTFPRSAAIIGGLEQESARALQTVRPESATRPMIQCDYDACSRFYRSFREADCTYQPYRGPRKLCLRGSPVLVTPDGSDGEIELEDLEEGSAGEALMTGGIDAGPSSAQCNYDACSRAYRSFRESDCTFQPYRGGRKLCQK